MRTAQNDTNMISVSVSRFGQSTVQVTVPVDSTVGEVLTASGVSTGRSEQLFVAGVPATMNDIMENGDILSVVTPKQAGQLYGYIVTATWDTEEDEV